MMLSAYTFNEFSKLCPIPEVFGHLILPSGPTVNDVLHFCGVPPLTHETIPLSLEMVRLFSLNITSTYCVLCMFHQ